MLFQKLLVDNLRSIDENLRKTDDHREKIQALLLYRMSVQALLRSAFGAWDVGVLGTEYWGFGDWGYDCK